MSTSEDKSNLTSSLCLIWETERPYENITRRSPRFTYMNCEWHLVLMIAYSTGKFRQTMLRLTLVLDNKEKGIPMFAVETYYKNKGISCDPLFYTITEIKQLFPWRYHISNIPLKVVEEKIRKSQMLHTFRIVCVFESDGKSPPLFEYEGWSITPKSAWASTLLRSKNTPECPSSSAGDQPFSLENLSKDLEALLDNKILPDVQLMVEGTSIPCHRSILVARSKVFAATFQHEMTESASGVLKINDIDLPTTEVFLKYVYSGKIPDGLTDDMLLKLFKTGDKYDVSALKTVTSRRMIKDINDENFLSYLSLADSHSDQEFKDAVVRYIVKDGRLIKSEAWKNFAAENSMLAVEVYSKYMEK